MARLLPKRITVPEAISTAGLFLFLVLLFLGFVRLPFTASLISAVQGELDATSLAVRDFTTRLFTNESTYEQHVTELQEQLEALAIDHAQFVQLQEAHQQLQETLDYKTTSTTLFTTARVTARLLDTQQLIQIDKGSADNITVGSAVTVSEGHLIGTVLTVRKYSADVLLLQDVDSKIPTAILGSDKTIGLTQGQGGYLLRMNYIPQEERINVGDLAVTSGLAGGLPNSLVIGVVIELIEDESATFKEALIEPIVTEHDYTYVNVMTPSS